MLIVSSLFSAPHAPSLARFAESLSSPIVTSFPKDLGDVMQSLGDLAQRLQPLGQFAETAGGWFGLRPLAALRSGGGNARSATPVVHTPPPAPPKPAITPPIKKAVPKKRAAAKKTVPAKKAAARKAAPQARR